MYGLLGSYSIWLRYNYLKMSFNWKYWEIAFKVVQMKFLAMYITNQKLSFWYITVRNLQNIFMEHDVYLMS